MSKIDEIVNGYASNTLTYIDREGEHNININEFIKLGDEQVLQKLNRSEQVLLKIANAAPEKLKWVNDYAMAKVVKKLYDVVDGLNTDVITRDSEIERLKNENAASRVGVETQDSVPKEQAEELLGRIAELEADEQILQSQLNQVITERDTALENEDVAIKQYESLKERFDKSVEAYKALKSEKDSLDVLVTNMSQESDTLYNKLVADYDELNTECKNKTDEITKLKDDLENASSEINIISERHNNSIKEYEHTIEKLNVRIDNIMEDNNKLTGKIAELQQMKTDLEQECNGYAADFEKASARCQEIDSRNEELNTEYEKQQDLISKLEEQYNDACEELNNLKNSFGEATGKIRELDSSNVELQNKITEQDNLITGLNETISNVNNEMNELQNTLEEKVKEIALLNAKIRNSENSEEKIKMFENAINNFLNEIGYKQHTENVTENNQAKPTIHRMGDNQVVNFNLGM